MTLRADAAPPPAREAAVPGRAAPPAVVTAAGGEAARAREEKLKAALVLRIAERVAWPDAAFPAADTPLSVCAVGAEPLGLAVDDLDGREIAGRKVEVHRFDNPRELEFCHVLFIAASERARRGQILEATARAPVLTAGTDEDFAEEGGVVELRVKALRVGYELNSAAAERAGLVFDRTLLDLADRVHR